MKNKTLLEEVTRMQGLAGLTAVGSFGAPYQINEDEETDTTSDLAKDFRALASKLTQIKGMSTKEIMALDKLIDTIVAKAQQGEIGVAIEKAQKALDVSTSNIKQPTKPIG